MKSRLMVASAAGLLVMAGFANAQDTLQAPQPAPIANATTPAASPGTGTSDYGGVPSTKTESGVKHATPCSMDPQCNIFFGS